MRIRFTSILVDDQEKALRFYTEKLGFVKAQEIPLGEFRWLTVKSPEGGDVELSLEPNVNPAARTYQAALLAQGIAWTAFEVDDVHAEHERLSALGVRFTREPAVSGPVTTAVFEDTCGNLLQIYTPPVL